MKKFPLFGLISKKTFVGDTMKRKTGLIVASAMIFVLLSSLVCAVATNPGHSASMVGGDTLADTTFQNVPYGFPNNLAVGNHLTGMGGTNPLYVADGLDQNVLDANEHVRFNLGPQEKPAITGVLATRVSDSDSYCEWEEHNDYEYLNCAGPNADSGYYMGDYVGPWSFNDGSATSSWVRNGPVINIGVPPIEIRGGLMGGPNFVAEHTTIEVDEDGEGGADPVTVYHEQTEVETSGGTGGEPLTVEGVGGLVMWGEPGQTQKKETSGTDGTLAENGYEVLETGLGPDGTSFSVYNDYDFQGSSETGGSTTFQTGSPADPTTGTNHPTTSLTMGPGASSNQVGNIFAASYDAAGDVTGFVSIGGSEYTGDYSATIGANKPGGVEGASMTFDPEDGKGDISVYINGGGMHGYGGAGMQPFISPVDQATAGWGVSQLQMWPCDPQAVPAAATMGCDAYVGVMPGLQQVVSAIDFGTNPDGTGMVGQVPTNQGCTSTAHICIGR